MTGFRRVAVVGAGLIGGSIVRRLHDLGLDVVVVDPDPHVSAAAATAGLAVADDVPADRDLVVLATPLDAMATAMVAVAATAPDAVVIDVGSVKVAAGEAAAAAGLTERYVGCHPMAGTELSGFEHSEVGLLVEATWAVVRGPDAPLTERVVSFLCTTFDATVVVLDAAEHDRAVALVSHVPHTLANALLELVEHAPDSPAARHLAAGSFRSGTRVAGGNAPRSLNMLADNAAALGPALDDVIALLQAYRRELDDPVALRSRLTDVADRAHVVRTTAPAWTPCPDLVATLGSTDRPLLVRRRAAGFETAPA